jgi:hypothetical protein
MLDYHRNITQYILRGSEAYDTQAYNCRLSHSEHVAGSNLEVVGS